MVSGAWYGWYAQRETQVATNVYLFIFDERLFGWGTEDGGIFTLDGLLSETDGRVAWVKTYLGRHAVHYAGAGVDGNNMWGLWSLPGVDVGSWQMTLCERELAPTLLLDGSLGRGLKAWLAQDYEAAAMAFVDASNQTKRSDVAVVAMYLCGYVGSTKVAKRQLALAKRWQQSKDSDQQAGVLAAIRSFSELATGD